MTLTVRQEKYKKTHLVLKNYSCGHGPNFPEMPWEFLNAVGKEKGRVSETARGLCRSRRLQLHHVVVSKRKPPRFAGGARIDLFGDGMS